MRATKQKKQPRKPYSIALLVSIIVLLAAGAVGVAIHRSHQTHNKKTASHTQTQTPPDTNSQGSPGNTNTDKGSTPPATYTPPASNNGITLTPSTSGDTVVVSTQLAGYSDGTCKLTATNGSKTSVQTANVIYAPSFSTCAGFTVPIADLGNGTWSLTLDVTSGGTTNSKTATYEVK